MSEAQHTITPERRQITLLTERKPLVIGGLTLECMVGQKEDGTKVDIISGRGLEREFGQKGHHGTKSIVLLDAGLPYTVENYIPQFLAAKNLWEVATPDLRQHFMPYIYKIHGMTTYGYDVEILKTICALYSRAWRAGLLDPQQIPKANLAMNLQEALAGVALHALVQQACGYEWSDYQKLLETYLVEIPLKWKELFHRKFCELAFALHGRKFSHKHGLWFMGFVHRAVWVWVPQCLNEEINRRNPTIDQRWRRRKKKHQFCSEEEGRALITDQIKLVMMAGRKTLKHAQRTGRLFHHCRPYFYQELKDLCEDEQVVQVAWDRALHREHEADWHDMPLFQQDLNERRHPPGEA
jgi:hypothetical protein